MPSVIPSTVSSTRDRPRVAHEPRAEIAMMARDQRRRVAEHVERERVARRSRSTVICRTAGIAIDDAPPRGTRVEPPSASPPGAPGQRRMPRRGIRWIAGGRARLGRHDHVLAAATTSPVSVGVHLERRVDGYPARTTASAIGPSSWWRALERDRADVFQPASDSAARPANTSSPCAGSTVSEPSRCSITRRRGGWPRLCTLATVSCPR